ncbi:MAG: DEAD/DEAH box helicase [Acidobacteriota bacterium]
MDLSEGVYARLVSRELARRLEQLEKRGWRIEQTPLARLDEGTVRRLLARYLAGLAEGALEERSEALRAARLVDAILAELARRSRAVADDDRLDDPPRRLEALAQPPGGLATPDAPKPPALPLEENALLANAPRERNTLTAILDELRSADRVDLIVAFLRWSGYRLLRGALARLLERRGPGALRVITTTYLGATHARVLEDLVRLGAQVRVTYETSSTRLHAKAWLFHRASGATTALLGSSNLSQAALVDGLEWNVRLSHIESPALVDRMTALFEGYWENPAFEPFDPEHDAHRLRDALRRAGGEEPAGPAALLELRPYPFQQQILDRLEAERTRGHRRNLVVAATGTGKTVVAALDFRRLRERARREERRDLRLLYVAHRREILEQARETFRHAVGDRDFGELLAGAERPRHGRHVFASIQSLHGERLERIDPGHYDYVLVDECHHAPARSWKRLLAHLRPRWLVGLTATPERMDGESILPWFDDRIAAEIRLWDALDEQLLCPFHYFVNDDGTDLSAIDWSSPAHVIDAELEKVYTGNDARVRQILHALRSTVADPDRMRALGFCVSVAHAEYMAERFGRAGLRAAVLCGETPRNRRRQLRSELLQGTLNILFTVDVFNEGVDLPEVDTVLFLRPTQSITVFLQQLGRGLRHAPGKSCLTVLDFVGNMNATYRIDRRFQALFGATRRELAQEVESGFPHLPPGCSIVLEERAQRQVLAIVRANLRNLWPSLRDDLAAMLARGERPGLGGFLAATGASVDDLYGQQPSRCWTALRREAGWPMAPVEAGEKRWYRLPARLLHVDDPPRVARWRELLRASGRVPADDSVARMLWPHLVAARHGQKSSLGLPDAGPGLLEELRRHVPIVEELDELLDLLADRADGPRVPLAGHDPLCLHARYTRGEIFSALGAYRQLNSREGVVRLVDQRRLLLFVTLDKSGAGFTENTRYEDYAISDRLFHWQSQWQTRLESPLGRLYRHHEREGVDVLLFVRERRKTALGLGAPFVCLGTVRYLHCEPGRERPLSITWRLDHPMPGWLLEKARAAG